MSFFSQQFTGLGFDISDHHIRIARASFFGRVRDLIEINLPEGLVVDEKVQNPKELARIVSERLAKEVLSGSQLRATLLVPESRVFSHSVEFDGQTNKLVIEEQARASAAKEIPIPFSQASVAVSSAKKVQGKIRTTVYAAEKDVIEGLSAILDPDEFSLIAMEANTKALFRLIRHFGKPNAYSIGQESFFGIVDVGSSWATISVYATGGSNLFSRTLSFKTRFSKMAVDDIYSAIDEVMLYFQQREMKISTFIFAGVEGEDRMFGKKGDFQKIGDAVVVPGLTKREVHTFGAAIGAAIRSVKPWKFVYQHNFQN